MKNSNQNSWSEFGSKSMKHIGNSGVIGGALGALIGAGLAIGTALLVPGLFSIIGIAIFAVIAGAITGGAIGAMIGLGIPREQGE
jgi:hypothetical protein